MEEARAADVTAARPRNLLAVLALPELLLVAFYLIALTGVLASRHADPSDIHPVRFAVILLVYLAGIGLLRFQAPRIAGPRLIRAVRRLFTLAALLTAYFQLRWIIPAINPGIYDGFYNSIDVAVFGAPVSVLFEPYQTYAWVEWFSFFYWTYFYMMAVYVVGRIFFEHQHDERFTWFATGIILIHLTGWCTYFVAPGFGPYDYLKDVYAGPLPGGRFLEMSSTAYHWGALRDIFPSIHTAVMSLIAADAFRNWHRSRAYRIFAVPVAFWALQIVIATIYCRWHYAVDVAAGLLLTVAVFLAPPRLAARWGRWRTTHGEPDPWF